MTDSILSPTCVVVKNFVHYRTSLTSFPQPLVKLELKETSLLLITRSGLVSSFLPSLYI
jgi:hypothetical protein